MGIELEWLVPDKVIFGRYFDVITPEELRNAMDQTIQMIDETETHVFAHRHSPTV
jgi:hypothetical protein